MAEVENLAIVIDVIEQYEEELATLLATLEVVERQAERVDDINIRVDVKDAQLDALVAKLAAIEGADAAGLGDVDVRAGAMGAARGMGAMDEAADNVDLFNLRMSDVHNALAKLIPFILVIIGALPAMIGGLVALGAAALAAAAALMGLTAFAAMGAAMARGDGMGEGFMDILEEIQEDFMEAFRPLMQNLAPLFERALSGLEGIFDELAARGDVMLQFMDDAQRFGAWFSDWIVSVIADTGRFADAASDALAILASGDRNWFEAFAGFLADVLPSLVAFGSALMDMLPALLEISIGFLLVAGGAMQFITAIGTVLSYLPITAEQLGIMVGMTLSLYTAVLLLRGAFLKAAAAALVSMGRSMIQLVSVIAGYLGVSGPAIASTLGLAASFKVLAAAIALTGIGAIAVAFGFIANRAAMASTDIDKATKSLKEFQKQQDRMSGGKNPYADPNLRRGEVGGSSPYSGGTVNVTVEGDADEDTLRNQTNNALYRMERPIRR